MQNNEPTLTYIQLVAIRGRIANELADCKNIADKKYKCFILVNIADYAKENYAYFINCIKEYLDEEIVNEAYLFKSAKKAPIIYWINKNREDILSSKKDNNILRSIFMSFMNKVIEIDADAGKELLEEFEKDYRLKFLADLYIYYNERLKESHVVEGLDDEKSYLVKSKIYPILFKDFEILSVKTELLSKEKNDSKIFGETKFIVKKVLKGSGRVVQQKEFDTEEAADDYKQMILLEYPELSNDFDFIKEAKVS